MKQRIEELLQEIQELKAQKLQDIEEYRIRLLGKKGAITKLFEDFREVLPEQKRELGQKLNSLKNMAASKLEELKEKVEDAVQQNAPKFDFTKPGDKFDLGTRHPISITREEILSIFSKFGYAVAEGPEIEDDWHVFGALNFPPEHPARDMQDTFFISQSDNPVLLRTHTSSVQVRAMERMPLPIRIVCPGRVFRNEAISARAHCIFHQVEGLYIDKNVRLTDLKSALDYLFKNLFGKSAKTRLRPSFFPFTEPSFEVDFMSSDLGKLSDRWIEIMGCGMVDPNVLKNVGLDPDAYSGYAFGLGVERVAMLMHSIDDIRHFYTNDVRFLRQFGNR